MALEIRPSLAQMLQPQSTGTAAPARPQAQTTQAQAAQPAAGGFSNAMAAQRAFFQQVTAPKVTPATYTAADVARASQAPAPQPQTVAPATTADPSQPRRPGSFLNIVV